jgi:hypothetical protein
LIQDALDALPEVSSVIIVWDYDANFRHDFSIKLQELQVF